MRWILPLLVWALASSLGLASVDTDGDGVIDNREIADGTNPNDSASFYPLSRGLLAHYQLDGDGSDASGFGRNATNFGANPTENRFGFPNQALTFDGNDYLQTPVDSNLNAVTLSAWFASSTRSGERSIVDSDSGGPYGQSLILGYANSDNTLDVQFHDGFYNSPWALNDSNWHHAVAVIEPSVVRLYVDGKLVGSQIYNRTSLDGSQFRIGRHNAVDPQWFRGQIDDVRIYNRALSSQEVASLYYEEAKYAGFGLAGAATKAPFDPATAANWSSGGTEWTVDASVTHDGVDSVKAQTTDGQSTYREYTLTGPAVVDFWWKVSSERNFDTFSYSLNGVNQETISGEVDWTYRTLTLPAGDHTIRWTYFKDDSGAIGQDAGWLDEFAVYPAEATLAVRDGAAVLTGTTTVDFGSTALQGSSPSKTLTFANEGYVPLEVVIFLPEGSPFFFEEGSAYELLLGRGESVEVPIFLSTDSAGTKTAQLSISAPDSVTAPPTVTLQGVLLGQKIGVAQGGNSLDSGQTIDMGLAPSTLQFTISNTGNVGNLDISSITATGNFQITQQPQTSIAPQSSTSFTVLAQAVAFGNQTGGITITSNDPDTPTFTIVLSATAFAVGGEGILSDSMVTSGSGGAVGWDLASTQLPSGATGQAIKTGSTPNNGGSVLEFTSQTAGVVTWSWKVSTQEEFDWLLCEVDGQEAAGISTKNGVWQTQVVQVPAGATIRWVYRKDGSGSIGEDAGYLADVALIPMSGQLSFADWGDTYGYSDPKAALRESPMKAVFAWLSGFDPAVGPNAGHYTPIMEGSRLKYRFLISKSANGKQLIQFSSDLTSWTTRQLSQRVISDDNSGVLVEVTGPSRTRGFLRAVGEASPMVHIRGGATSAGFLIGRTEVTWSDWQGVKNWAIANGYDMLDRGKGSGQNYPVRNVNWYDVVKWCNAKSEMKGLQPVYLQSGSVYRSGESTPEIDHSANGYRLPTALEWEWAARGGSKSRNYIYSGSNDLKVVGWYFDNSSGAVGNEGAIFGASGQGRGSWPVASKQSNELGLYDMSGNVSEWVEDRHVPNSTHFARGGMFFDVEELCRVSHLAAVAPWSREPYIGFRVARNADD